ncbi:helix-turn-helix domain-containing protein [Vibrio sp. TRT 1302]|uniref:helix-turn-helix domain-containing protein n=1 Tax=Vibrio sp. TRT 1302 TaxID=3418504 RepID=UPI003CE7DAFE
MIFEEIGGIDALSERVKHAIKDNGGYDLTSEYTGISVSTLKRIAAGKTEPKFKDIVSIAEATRTPLMFLAYGNGSVLESKFEMLMADMIREARKKDYDMSALKMSFGMVLGSLKTIASTPDQKKELDEFLDRIMDEFDAPLIE